MHAGSLESAQEASKELLEVHRRSLNTHLAKRLVLLTMVPTYLLSWMNRGTVRVTCLAKEHNTVTPTSTQTQSFLNLQSKVPFVYYAYLMLTLQVADKNYVD